MELPVILPGEYQTLCRLSVRNGAGLNFQKQEHRLPAYERISIKEVKYLSVSVWGKTKEGWICMYMNHTFYVEKCRNYETVKPDISL